MEKLNPCGTTSQEQPSSMKLDPIVAVRNCLNSGSSSKKGKGDGRRDANDNMKYCLGKQIGQGVSD